MTMTAGAPALHRRHVVERRQELDGDGDLRVAAAAAACRSRRSRRRTCRTTRIPCRGGRRDRPRAGGAGRGVRARARAGDEPDPAQAERQRREPGRRERARVEDAVRARVLRARRRAARARAARRTRIWRAASTSIVIEGAGSVTELNLRDHDLVNLGLVTRLRAPWLLVADIERGGVFASVVGTVAAADRRRARAVPRLRDQQVPRRHVAVRRRRADARGADRRRPASACFRTPPTCTSTPRTAWRSTDRRARAAAAGRAHRDRPLSAAVERDRLPPADMGGLDRRRRRPTATTSSSCPAARTRSPIWRGCATTGLADWICEQHRARRDGHRHLRRLPDAGTHDSRSGRRRVVTPATPTGLGLLPVRRPLSREKRTRAVAATTRRRRRVRRLRDPSRRDDARSARRRRAVRARSTTATADGVAPRRRRSAPTCTARSSIRTCAPRCSASTRRRPTSKAGRSYRAAGRLVRDSTRGICDATRPAASRSWTE